MWDGNCLVIDCFYYIGELQKIETFRYNLD